MRTITEYMMGMIFAGAMTGIGMAGEAASNAWASNGLGRSGSAGATASYDGEDGGIGFAKTRTKTGQISLARGLAVGFDRDGIDISFSHAIAGKVGPAYAGTLNLSIGLDGHVSGSYGGALAQGGQTRSAEAGGSTRSYPGGAGSVATATGNTWPGGQVVARTNSFSREPYHTPARRVVRVIRPRR
jgi:hypothetical protein